MASQGTQGDDSVTGRRGDHALDRYIKSLIQQGRTPGRHELAQIIDHVAQAPLASGSSPLRTSSAGRTMVAPSERANRRRSLISSSASSSIVNGRCGRQKSSTLGDLRRVLRLPGARFGLTFFAQTYLVIAVARTDDVVDVDRQGPRAGPNVAVFYSANSGILTTGHQMSDAEVAIKLRDVRWLS